MISEELYKQAKRYANYHDCTTFTETLNSMITDTTLRNLGMCLLHEIYRYEKECLKK